MNYFKRKTCQHDVRQVEILQVRLGLRYNKEGAQYKIVTA